MVVYPEFFFALYNNKSTIFRCASSKRRKIQTAYTTNPAKVILSALPHRHRSLINLYPFIMSRLSKALHNFQMSSFQIQKSIISRQSSVIFIPQTKELTQRLTYLISNYRFCKKTKIASTKQCKT